MSEVRSFNNFSVNSFSSLSPARSRGVGVVLRKSLLHNIHCIFDPEGRVITFDFYLGEQKMRLTNVYAPADHSETNNFFCTLSTVFVI